MHSCVPVRPCKEDQGELVWEDRWDTTYTAKGGDAALIWHHSSPPERGSILVTGSDAAQIALSWFHAHFRVAAITTKT